MRVICPADSPNHKQDVGREVQARPEQEGAHSDRHQAGEDELDHSEVLPSWTDDVGILVVHFMAVVIKPSVV